MSRERKTTAFHNSISTYFHEKKVDFDSENEATNSFEQCQMFLDESGYTQRPIASLKSDVEIRGLKTKDSEC